MKPNEDKCLERLFSVYEYCELNLTNFKPREDQLYEQETFEMKKLCDIEVPEGLWATRLFKIAIIIIEILIERNEIKTAIEIIEKNIARFPNNQILVSLLAKSKLKKGEFTNSGALFEQVINISPKDVQSDLNMFNRAFQFSHEKKYGEAKEKFTEFASKYPQYQNLSNNNIAYVLTAEGNVQQAIELLENTIKNDPHNINEAVIYNLLSLYEFYYDDPRDKKRIIEEIIDKYARDSFNKAHLGNLLKK